MKRALAVSRRERRPDQSMLGAHDGGDERGRIMVERSSSPFLWLILLNLTFVHVAYLGCLVCPFQTEGRCLSWRSRALRQASDR
jgi:hypothetical protein